MRRSPARALAGLVGLLMLSTACGGADDLGGSTAVPTPGSASASASAPATSAGPLSPTATSQAPPGGGAPRTTSSTTASSFSVDAVDAGEVQRIVELMLGIDERYDRLINSFLVSVDGRTIVERYGDGAGPEQANQVYSVTKSVMATLVGIAIGEGAIRGTDATLGELLPDRVGVMAPGVADVTLEQLLTMTSGVIDDQTLAETLEADAGDWVDAALAAELQYETGEWAYSSSGSHLPSAIVSTATGRSVLEYAREKLLDPLGIATATPAEPPVDAAAWQAELASVPGFAWPVDPQGHHVGGYGIQMTARDMLKFGQLYLDGGRWNGQQVVPEAWVRTSTEYLVRSPAGGYGYHWWIVDGHGHAAFAAFGYAGQLIEVVPDLRLVVVASARDDPARMNPEDLAGMVSYHVIPAMGG